ncbi:hypothetical protein JCM10049v2_006151 [Rhodotorula toruloides]
MSDRARTASAASMRAPPKKRKRSVSVASDVQSAASSLTWASARMTAAHLEEFYEDPWSYTQKQVELVETCTPADLDRVADSMWAETSWQITASHVVGPRGMVKFNRRCAVTLKEEGDLESAHLVPARRENYFNGTFCRGQLDANRIELSGPVHLDFDKQLLDMLPNQDQVVSRVLCEIKYQEERAAASTSGVQGENVVKPPARPPFEKFYAAAEKTGACFRLIASNLRPSPYILRYDDPDDPTTFALEGIAADDPFRWLSPKAKKPSTEKPVLPSLVAPSFFNMLTWATRDRVRRKPPYSKSLIQETSILDDFIALLLSFWFVTDDTPASDVAALLNRAKPLVKDHGGAHWAQQLEDLATKSYIDIVNAVTLPANALRSQDPRPEPEQHALMLAAATADDDASTTFSVDLSEGAFSDSDSGLPADALALPYVPLTAAALEALESG